MKILNFIIKSSIIWVPIFIFFGFNLTGVCYSKFKILSDEEIIDRQLAILISNPFSLSQIRHWSRDEKANKIIMFRSVQEVKDKNPDCCILGQPNIYFDNFAAEPVPKISLIDRILGYAWKILNVRLNYTYLNESNDAKVMKISSQYWVDTCGRRKRER